MLWIVFFEMEMIKHKQEKLRMYIVSLVVINAHKVKCWHIIIIDIEMQALSFKAEKNIHYQYYLLTYSPSVWIMDLVSAYGEGIERHTTKWYEEGSKIRANHKNFQNFRNQKCNQMK